VIDLRIRSTLAADALEAKVGQVVTEAEYDVALTGAARVLKPDGTLLCVYLPKAISAEATAKAVPVLHTMKGITTDNRGLAAGSGRVTRGEQSRARSKLVASAIVGSIDPGGVHHYCRQTAWTGDHLPELEALYPMLAQVDNRFARYAPEQYAAQRKVADATWPEWRLDRTAFTTLTVNNTYPTGVHMDKGDLPNGFSTIVVFRRGDYSGCELVFPRYRVGVDLKNRDLILMDAHEWHGNTFFRSRTPDAERISVVCYYRTKMADCGRAGDEERKAHLTAASRSGLYGV
jgi:hypothetical protein